ncbi:MAG TPA: ATP synthase F1 subunit epsilon [Thermoanaerobaculia bacterium]|nr:ATP synthase F1 subunit epsilon [Thermoanaerobaculia bacterium]
MEAGHLTLTVVTPERSVVERVPCDAVSLPGELGELGILPGHTPLVALLGVGRVTWSESGRKTSVAVRGGFVEVADDAVRVLADLAAEKDAIDAAEAREAKGEGEARRLTVVGNEQLEAVNADVAFAEAKLAVAQGG